LLQPVHEEDLVFERGAAEVDDHLHPFRRSDAEALHQKRVFQEVRVGCDGGEGLSIAQGQGVDARVRPVQYSETLLSARPLEKGLDEAVHEEFVAYKAVVVEAVEDEEAVLIELAVLEDEADVKLPAWQPQSRRRVRLLPGIERVEVGV